MKLKEKITKEVKTKPKEDKDFYLNEEAKNWDFSEYVRVTSGPHGMTLSFGKFIREREKYGIFKEITLPYEIADSLCHIIEDQFHELVDKGLLRKIKKPEK